MQKLVILFRMLRNRLASSNPSLRSEHTSTLDRVAFVLNFFPPYNLMCWAWIAMAAKLAPRARWIGATCWSLMERGLLFGALRHVSPETRTAFASSVVLPVLKQRHPAHFRSTRSPDVSRLVHERGFAPLGRLISAADAAAAVDYFCRQNGYASQTPLQSDGVLRPFTPQTPPGDGAGRYFCFPSATSIACPQVTELIQSGLLREVAAAYLGFLPELYSVNTIATVPGDSQHYVMRLHRDYDAFASLTFFVCWTEVAAENGATIYVPGSHRSSSVDQSSRAFLEGQAGEVFAVDAFGLHAGNSRVTGPRLSTWIRYGSVPNLGTIQDPDLVPIRHFA